VILGAAFGLEERNKYRVMRTEDEDQNKYKAVLAEAKPRKEREA